MQDSSEPAHEDTSILSDDLVRQLTHLVTVASTGRSHVVVRPGLALAMYYAEPLHVLGDALTRMVEAYLDLAPAGALSALSGRNGYWEPFRSQALIRKLKKAQGRGVRYTNVDLGSGPLLASEGPYGWHLNGGNLTSEVRHDDTNVVYHELPHDEIERGGAERLVEWAVSVAELHPFETGQLGYSFNQLQRTFTFEADSFVGQVAMRFRGFDILEPDLARVARGRVPNCSWLNFLGDGLVETLGGEGAVARTLTPRVCLRRIRGGLLLRAGERPPIGDVGKGAFDLEAVHEVARLTRPLRPAATPLYYGTEEFSRGWIGRLDG